jgi:gamma-glutamyltranspeptidase/glutathione hydrolase
MHAAKTFSADVTFRSRRSEVFSTHGMVACSQPLAAQIGVDLLRRGGNAVDAAIAVAAGLNVTEPCSTGLGGDCFMLFYDARTRQVHALNGSGRAPAALTLDRVLEECPGAKFAAATRGSNVTLGDVCPYHAHAVTVPGTAAGWCDAVARWGSGAVTLADVLQPAIDLARRGFPVSPITAHWWHQLEGQLRNGPHSAELMVPDTDGDLAASDSVVVVVGGGGDGGDGGGGGIPRRRAPRTGEVFRNPALASVMQRIAKEGKAGYYQGPVAEALVKVLRDLGGCMTLEDLAAHETTFPDPISTECVSSRGACVHACVRACVRYIVLLCACVRVCVWCCVRAVLLAP